MKATSPSAKQSAHSISSVDENITPHQIPSQSKHRLSRKKRLSKTKLKYLLSGLGLLLLIIGGASALFLSKTDQDIRQQASADPLKVDLTLNPNNLSTQKNQAVDIPLVFDTKNATMTAADVRLNFNPELIKINSITKADLSLELSAPQIENNHATFTFAASLDSGGVKGTGTLAVINAELLQENKGSIIIGSATQVVAIDSNGNAINENALGDKTSHDLEYDGGNPTSPSPTPTTNPTASPSPSPTPTPSPTSTPQTSPSPNPTDDPGICTQDAKQCPDGSWVGRTGPDCEFVCPAGSNGGSGGQEIKSCNEACNSSGECEVNHFCYSGYCRLVDNPTSLTCSTTNDDSTNNDMTDKNDDLSSLNNNDNYDQYYNDEDNTNNTQQLAVVTAPNCNDTCTSHNDCHDNLRCFNGNCRNMANPKSSTCNPVANAQILDIDSSSDSNTGACTQDAKQCPDGSWVSRTGPNCEFVCPKESGNDDNSSTNPTSNPQPQAPSSDPQPVDKKASFFDKIIQFLASIFN